MKILFHGNTGVCPKCSGTLVIKHGQVWCNDCKNIYEVVSRGIADNELTIKLKDRRTI